MAFIALVSENVCTAVRNKTLVQILIPSDIDECLLDIHECDVNATCNNTIGDYDCQCNTGFRGDGFVCTSKLIESYLRV